METGPARGIDYFKGTITAQTGKIDELLGHEPLAIGDLILTEVLAKRFTQREISGRYAARLSTR